MDNIEHLFFSSYSSIKMIIYIKIFRDNQNQKIFFENNYVFQTFPIAILNFYHTINLIILIIILILNLNNLNNRYIN